jgi:hypothetical protein
MLLGRFAGVCDWDLRDSSLVYLGIDTFIFMDPDFHAIRESIHD